MTRKTPDVRLIERWLPIAELGIEGTRERTPMTPFPAPNRLHVWWARRPLVASRAAVLASLLPAGADRERFLHVLGIHGDPVAARRRIAAATRRGERLGAAAYGYKRAFSFTPGGEDKNWVASNCPVGSVVLDPCAGGGSIPFEAVRLGFDALANDLNPVASLLLRATVEWPATHGNRVKKEFEEIGARLAATARERLAGAFPEEPKNDTRPDGYLWARTIICPYCGGLIPLSPNWRLAGDGTGVRLLPELGGGPGSEGRVCDFEIVSSAAKQSKPTVTRGVATCPYPDCGRVVDGDEIKRQAQGGGLGEQLYAVAYKKRIPRILKSGRRGKDKWVRGYRAPRASDDNRAEVEARLAEKLPEWDARDVVPSEVYGHMFSDRSRIYGVKKWTDLFSPRQLLCHGTSVEVFREMLVADRRSLLPGEELTEERKAAYVYLAFAIDKLISYNSRMCTWHSYRSVVGPTFSTHDFSFKWSYAEMAPLVTGLGYDWAIRETAKCYGELVSLIRPEAAEAGTGLGLADEASAKQLARSRVAISCKSGDALDHVADGSVDAVVVDPPYYDNVMYAELSDFFYVWLKRTAGRVYPEFFRRVLTDKENEAVANPARFRGEKGAKRLAGIEYGERMASIFAECRRVLKPDGIMTLMFTHKAAGAWDALATGLMDSGFAISASWPINTEAPGSLHIKDKAAAKSTIFLVCRPRGEETYGEEAYWEDVEPRVGEAVRSRIGEFQEAGISGVDLYLACFGPALEEFSRRWPLRRGTPRKRLRSKRTRVSSVEEDFDPYAATPEDALNAARREVKRWRLEELANLKRGEDLDGPTAFFVLAWDAFRAPGFPYDEALKLARAVGVDLEREAINRFAGKKGANLLLWDSEFRAAKGALGPASGARGMIDPLHRAAHLARSRSLQAAKELIEGDGLDKDPSFFTAFKAVLEVLPPSRIFTGMDLPKSAAASGSDFEVLYNLSRLFFSERVPKPEQLALWSDEEPDI